MQKKIMTGQQRIRENAGLGQARPVTIALVNYFANRESAGAIPEDGMLQAPVNDIAKAAGCKEDAYRRQRDRIAGAGLLRYELRPVPIQRTDHETGEIVTTLEKRQFIGMPEDCANVVDFTERLAQARIDGKQWGGQRTPCPACGEIAGQRITRIVTCLGCGHETRTEGTVDPTPQDADTVNEETTMGEDGTAPPPRKMRVGVSESPPVVNVSKMPHLAGRGVIEVDPLQAPLTAAFLAGESPHWSTDVKTG